MKTNEELFRLGMDINDEDFKHIRANPGCKCELCVAFGKMAEEVAYALRTGRIKPKDEEKK